MVRKIVLLMMILFLTAPLCQAQCFGNCAGATASGPIKFVYQRRLRQNPPNTATSYYNFAANVWLASGRYEAGTIVGDSFTKVRIMAQGSGTFGGNVTLTLQKNYTNTTIVCTLTTEPNPRCDTGDVALTISPNDAVGIEVGNINLTTAGFIENITVTLTQ